MFRSRLTWLSVFIRRSTVTPISYALMAFARSNTSCKAAGASPLAEYVHQIRCIGASAQAATQRDNRVMHARTVKDAMRNYSYIMLA